MGFRLQIKTLGELRLLRLGADVLMLGLLMTLSYNFKRFWFPTTQRGFFCNDESLMYPYRDSTVSSSLLHVLGFVAPLALLIIMELGKVCGPQMRRKGSWLHLWQLYNIVRYFLFGSSAQSLLKNLAKHTLGWLRPHFFDVCQPLLADGGSCADVQHRTGGYYHTNYSCQRSQSGASSRMLRDAHASFPSGHSSLAFYGLGFLALYLQHRQGRNMAGTLLWPLCQLACVLLASFVALSRVLDNKHHWSDVVAGSLLGAGVAFVAVRVALAQAAAEQQRQQLIAVDKGSNNNVMMHANGKEKELKQENAAVVMPSNEQQLPHDLSLVTWHASN